MLEPNESYARIQSIRIKNLEEQVHLMRTELRRLREGILQQNDVVKLSNLMEKLKEMNLVLNKLRSYYNCMQQSMNKHKKEMMDRNKSRDKINYPLQQQEPAEEDILRAFEINAENQDHSEQNILQEHDFKRIENECTLHQREYAGFDQRESAVAKTSQQSELGKRDTNETVIKPEVQEDFKVCKQLMDKTKSPSSILGAYLMRLQDFRADPLLRRQRLERKQQDELEAIQKRGYLAASAEKKIQQNWNNNETEKHLGELKQATAPKNQNNKERASSFALSLPVISSNLLNVIDGIINNIDRKTIALTVVLENDLLYHISVSQISNGNLLSCILATEQAIQEAHRKSLFKDLLTFFVVSAGNSNSQNNRILGHLFEFY